MEIDPGELAGAGREMECRVAALVCKAAEQPAWQAVFSDLEVNGWLANILKEKFPELLPKNVLDPRVVFKDNEAVVGFRYRDENVTTVISVRADAWIDQTDVLAVRLRRAHAGKLPIPLKRIVDHVNQAAEKTPLSIRWTQRNGSPIALVPLQDVLSTGTELRQLQTVELHKGELYLAGTTAKLEAVLAERPDSSIRK